MGKAERLIIYTLLAVLVVATFTDLGQTQAKDKPGEATFSKEINTKAIHLVGQNNKIRASFYLGVHDSPQLVLYDKEGTNRFNFGLAPAGNPGMSFNDNNGQETISFGDSYIYLFKEGGHSTYISGSHITLQGKGNALLIIEEGNLGTTIRSSHISLDGGAGYPSTSIWSSHISLDDKDGYARTFIGRDYITLNDEEHNTRAVLGSTDLKVPKTGTVIKRSPSSLVLFDKEGKVIWKAPPE